MGIFSAVAKVAKSAVKAVTNSNTLRNVKRAVKAAPDFIFGTGSDVAAKAMKNTKGSIFTKVKAGAKAIVQDSEKAAAKGGGFFKRVFNGLRTLPSAVSKGFKVGSRGAKIAKKSSFLGGLKGSLKAIGKRMPLIGSALCVLFEIPNIWDAAKNEGIGTALKETGKAVARLAGGAVGAVAGTCLGGPIGGIAGFAAGEWLVSKLTGATYSDKKDFLAEYGYDDNVIAQLKAQGYSFDDIYKEVKAAVKAQEELAENQPAQEEPSVPPEQPAAEQPAAPTPSTPTSPANPVSPTTPVNPADPANPTAPAAYTENEVAALRQMGLSDEDIQVLQNSGYTYNDVVALVKNINNANGAASGAGSSPASAPTTTGTTGYNPSDYYIAPFNLPYTMPIGSQQPGYYNPGFYTNPYSNDTYYNMLLSNMGMQNYNMSNPFLTGNSQLYSAQTYQTQNNNNNDNMYYKDGRLGYSA